jgi:hypothetical protein
VKKKNPLAILQGKPLWLRYGVIAASIPIILGIIIFPLQYTTVTNIVPWIGIVTGLVVPFFGGIISAQIFGCDAKFDFCIAESVPGYIIGYIPLVLFYFGIGAIVGLLVQRSKK